jgi:alpha-mannosidase
VRTLLTLALAPALSWAGEVGFGAKPTVAKVADKEDRAMRLRVRSSLPVLAATVALAAGILAGESPPAPWVSACWPLQDGKGDVAGDTSGHGNQGKIHGARWVQSEKGAALRFLPSEKAWVEVPNSPSVDLTEAITLDLEVKTYGSTGTWQGLLVKRDDANAQQKVQYQLVLDDRLQLFYGVNVGGPDNWWLPPTDTVLKPNQWHHVVAAYDAFRRQVKISVDGVVRKRLRGAPLVRTSNNPVRLGWTGWSNEYLNGEMRAVRVIDALAEKVAEQRAKGVDHCVEAGTDYLPHQFVSGPEALAGVLDVSLLNPRDAASRVTLRARIGEKTLEETQEVPGGRFGIIRCLIPELPAETPAHIELREQDKTMATDTIRIPGAKDWLGYRGYVVSHTHSDLCWPDTPEVCMNANVAAIATSVEIAEKLPNYRFTMEHVLFLREYLRRHPDKEEVLKKLMRAGTIETGAFYTGPWELTCGGEGLVRQLYLGRLWVKKHLGVDPVTVWNVDVAGHTAQMPQILQKAGIRGLVISAGATDNSFDQPYLLHETRGPYLFRWQAPDGSSVPTWSTPWGYGAGGALGLRNDTLDDLAALLPGFLEDVRKNHAAHDLPRVAFITDGTDIQSPTARVGQNVQRWNAEKRFPPLTYASTAELFRAVEQDPLPTYAGEMPSPWDQVQAQANECLMLDRLLEGRLLAAEKFAAFANLVSSACIYPQEQFNKIWENRLFTLEHNWGGKNGALSDQVKTDRIREADQINETLLQAALGSIAGAIRLRPSQAIPVVVFNPSSWDRKDVVTCDLPIPRDKRAQLAIADGTGKVVPHQADRGAAASVQPDAMRLVFCAEVPSLGYATYYVTSDAPRPQAASPFRVDLGKNLLENEFYRLGLDAATGGIRSIQDKRTGRELVRKAGPYACNELVALEDDDIDTHSHLTGKQWRMREHPSTIRVVEDGPVRLVIEVAGRFLESSSRRQEIILYRDLPRIDLTTILDWEGRKNIQVRQAFPLDVTNPRACYAVPYARQQYGQELKYAAPWPYGPVAGYSWRGVRGWVELGGENQSVTLASLCNYMAFKDPGAKAGPEYLLQPLLLRTARSCGDANLFYTQKGEHRFRFTLQAQADSARLGEEHLCPLLCHVPNAPSSGSASLPDRLSFGRITPPHVQIAVVKKAEDGQGIIVRVAEAGASREKTQAEVQFFKPAKGLVKTSIIEDNVENVPAQDGHMRFLIAPSGIETFRVSF